MTSFNLSELTNQLTEALMPKSGVSFANRSLKLDSVKDAEEVVEAIISCECLEYLDMEGNTLGTDAAKAIAEALKVKGSNLKKALWKDMFTGRLKEEIPKALEYLGNGLCTANTHLMKLDLSDNALGPIGVQGLAKFLTSSPCYTLQELLLNNNGLGISGGKMLAKALLGCHENSLKAGVQPLALKVFVAGRNRLENEGAKALADVFKKLTSLEEVVMPQNGIYHAGITALANGLSSNTNLRILNLNDNTLGTEGAKALASALHNFPHLEELNLGDCLLKTNGGLSIADALGIKGNHPSLKILNLSYNEIRSPAAYPIASAMADKSSLISLQLDGNAFGSEGRSVLEETLTASEQIHTLESLDCDESDDEGEEEDECIYDENDDENDEESSEEDDDYVVGDEELTANNTVIQTFDNKPVSVAEFLKSPTGENLLLIPSDNEQLFITHVKNLTNGNETSKKEYVEEFVRVTMVVSALCGSGYCNVRVKAEKLSEALYKELFLYASRYSVVSVLNNALLVNLGLLKSEDKKIKTNYNLEGCFKALEIVSQKDYFLNETRDTLKVFLEKPTKNTKTKTIDPFHDSKTSLKTVLNRN